MQIFHTKRIQENYLDPLCHNKQCALQDEKKKCLKRFYRESQKRSQLELRFIIKLKHAGTKTYSSLHTAKYQTDLNCSCFSLVNDAVYNRAANLYYLTFSSTKRTDETIRPLIIKLLNRSPQIALQW